MMNGGLADPVPDVEVRLPNDDHGAARLRSSTSARPGPSRIRSIRLSAAGTRVIVTWADDTPRRRQPLRETLACDELGGSEDVEAWMADQRRNGQDPDGAVADGVRLAQRCFALARPMLRALVGSSTPAPGPAGSCRASWSPLS